MIFYLYEEKMDWNTTYYTYFAWDDKNRMLYQYPTIRGEEELRIFQENPKEKMKRPDAGYATKEVLHYEEEFPKIRNGSWARSTFTTVIYNKTTEELGLYVPKKIEPVSEELKFDTVVDPLITEDMKKRIDENIKAAKPYVIYGRDYGRELQKNVHSKRYLDKMYCSKCGTYYLPRETRNEEACEICPTCGQPRYNNTIAMKEIVQHDKTEYNSSYYFLNQTLVDENSNMNTRFYYVKTNGDSGISIYRIVSAVSAENGTLYTKLTVEYSLEHNIGGEMASYKHLKKSKKLVDSFEALGINSKSSYNIPNIIWEDADTFLEFAKKNEKFLRMCGFMDVLKYSTNHDDTRRFFLYFIAITNKYPAMEQLIKGGYSQLFFLLLKDLKACTNIEEVNRTAGKLSLLVDGEQTTSKGALRFPSYIGDYLVKKGAPLQEYYYWIDVYELTHISKEQFEKMIDSFNYIYISNQTDISCIANILKFGYKIEPLFNYLIKQNSGTETSTYIDARLFLDYLNMCDILQITPDEYPQNLVKQHDDVCRLYNQRKNAEYDGRLLKIGTECDEYVLPKEDKAEEKPKTKDSAKKETKKKISDIFEEYTVVFPKSAEDFINEGNQQHNCVGSYTGNVKNGDCVIFFIRKKDAPEKSYVTAECRKNGLGQCFLSNNRVLNNDEVIDFAKNICKKIITGCRSGKIHALENVESD